MQVFNLYQDLSIAETLRYAGQLRKRSNRESIAYGLHYFKLFDLNRSTD
jgi:hypothetical protein